MPHIPVRTSRIHRALYEMHSALNIALGMAERGEKHSSMYFETAATKAHELGRFITEVGAEAEAEREQRYYLERIRQLEAKAEGMDVALGMLQDRVQELEGTMPDFGYPSDPSDPSDPVEEIGDPMGLANMDDIPAGVAYKDDLVDAAYEEQRDMALAGSSSRNGAH